jgi:hypothetical protein
MWFHNRSIWAELTMVRVGKEGGKEMEVGGRFPVISAWLGKSNLQKRSFTMTRRVPFLSALFPLVPLLAVVLVGFAQGQSAVEHEGDTGTNPQHSKAELPNLPCEDPVFSAWEYGGVGGDPGKNPELSIWEVLDLRAHMNKGLWEHDPAQTAPCIADGYIKIDERFGMGYVENNATRRLKNTSVPGGGSQHLDVVQFEHYIHLYVFGDHNDTVILTDLSKSVLRLNGKLSYGPRLNASVFVRQRGQWRMVANQTSDIPKGYAPLNKW